MDMNTVMDLIQKFGLPLVMLGLVLYAFKNYLDKFIAAADKDKAEFREMVLDKDKKLAEQHEWVRHAFTEILSECRAALQSVANVVERRDPNAPRIPVNSNSRQ